MRAPIALVLLFMVAGCTHVVAPATAPAISNYSSYDTKVPGRFVLILDSSLKDATWTIRPSTQLCAFHKYPVELGNSLSTSVNRTLQNVFEDVSVQANPPSVTTMAKTGTVGTIVVRLDDFTPTIALSEGFLSAGVNSRTDMSLGVTIRGRNGLLFGSSIGASRSAQGTAGSCGKAKTVLAESIELAIRDSMERMAERVANSAKVRSAADPRHRRSRRQVPASPRRR